MDSSLRQPCLHNKWFAIPLFVIFSLAGMAIIAYSTVWGPVVNSDSVYYILSADNWVKGLGFGLPWGSGRFIPFAGNPPFYPIVVAMFELLEVQMVAAARLICILTFGVTILAAGLLGYRASCSLPLAVCLSLLILTSDRMITLFSQAMSEPVFFATGLSGALWFLWYLETGRVKDLVISSTLVSATFLTRFTGVSLALACGLSILVLSKSTWRTRIFHGFVFGSIVVLPMLVWLRWGFLQTGELGERLVTPLSTLPAKLISFRLSAAEIIWRWMPWVGQQPADYNTLKLAFGAAFFVFAVLLGMAFFKNKHDTTLRLSNRLLLRWVIFFGLFSMFFLIVYILGYALTFPTPDLDDRLFSPLYVGGYFTLFGAVALFHQTWRSIPVLSALPWVIILILTSSSLPQAYRIVVSMHGDGSGYTGRFWRQSPLIAALRDLPPDIYIVTNEADAVLFLTGRPAVWLPDVIASQPAKTFTRFGDSPETPREEIAFRERGGALVIFPSIYRQLYGLYGDQTEARLQTLTDGLAVHARYGPAEAIYFYDEQSLP